MTTPIQTLSKKIIAVTTGPRGLVAVLHETNILNKTTVRIVLNSLRKLKRLKLTDPRLVFSDDLVKTLIEMTTYLLFRESDVRFYGKKRKLINMTHGQFFDVLEEVLYEVRALFDTDIITDYNGNSYSNSKG